MKYFHELCQEIQHERNASEDRRTFEDQYRMTKRNERDAKKSSNRERRQYAADNDMPKEIFNEMDRDIFFGTESDSHFLAGLVNGGMDDAVGNQGESTNIPGMTVEEAANEVVNGMLAAAGEQGTSQPEPQLGRMDEESGPIYGV